MARREQRLVRAAIQNRDAHAFTCGTRIAQQPLGRRQASELVEEIHSETRRHISSFPSFPGSAWERTAREAPASRVFVSYDRVRPAGAGRAVHSQAEPGNEENQR